MVTVAGSARVAHVRTGALAVILALLVAAGCGGSSTRHVLGDDGGSAGATGGSSSGGSGTGGTGSSTGGTGGSTGGTGGSTGGTGGSTGGTGSSTGGTGGSTGGTCAGPLPPCAAVMCFDGELIEPECGCPSCSCADVGCLAIGCGDGYEPKLMDGWCCPTCVPTQKPVGCEAVTCEPPEACPSGSSWRQPPGACCSGCVFDEPQGCPEIACPDLVCPPGYVPGDGQYGCCSTCVPDHAYCESDAECVLATNLDACCPCPEAINQRELATSECWSASFPPPDSGSDSGAAPDADFPICGNISCPPIACGACARNPYARCEAQHCTLLLGPER